ncbi:glycoside hydrolase family 127 protein [Gracilibacillus caseinilyticus]|uniref:Glycoside hydrolase family 127 protein n=1 Tax=Gracilibacillus caseinilyticus TaxID=2932256 RepID=A0ABY4ERJ2_9BACI|nr:beta-L-arabinofuranosidase domain-containing protein [Gracilibacillus caseinilyticus]UOQ46965.1 glycoside hydrolase family 127 protein [Gracilibacillus caseinilyticus]
MRTKEQTLSKMKPIPLKDVSIHDPFWGPWQQLVKNSIIPYQWDALNDRIPGAEPSRTIGNFEMAADRKQGTHYGMVFQDSDLYKWMETVAFSLQIDRDPHWENIMDDVIELIKEAQEDDGYLHTYFSVNEPDKKWTDLKEAHELYCAGHLIEAAVAYYNATGKKQIIEIVSKLVDHISAVLGNRPNQKNGYPGHPEIELALMKLYNTTKDQKYLDLCQYFIEERGQRNPVHYYNQELEQKGVVKKLDDRNYDYYQAHLPVREQTTAEGHAVRATYLYSGMVDLANELEDEELLEVCRVLWDNTVNKRMYVTGGIGSSSHEERFTVDYDLPNDRAYTETCASIALIMWAHRMVQIEADHQYTDILERALYNGALSGISLDGKGYFYVNPLEVWPHTANCRHDMQTVKTTRQQWFGCACCPPNIARLLASLGEYIYSTNDKGIFVHLYIGGHTSFEMDGQRVNLEQTSEYPWDGRVTFTISTEKPTTFTLSPRIPGWCRNAKIVVNGKEETVPVNKGYASITREWEDGDSVELLFEMPVEVVRAHPDVRNNAGKVVLQRGPVIYCLEENDNGSNLQDIQLKTDEPFTVQYEPELLEGVNVIIGNAVQTVRKSVENNLYSTQRYPVTDRSITAIPYYAWSNRGENEMTVWIREF